jgi:hypothetical protein
MVASKSTVRLARIRDGSLVARLRAADPAGVAATLARMSSDFSRGGLRDVARGLFAASIRSGLAPRADLGAAGSLVMAALPSPVGVGARHDLVAWGQKVRVSGCGPL